MNKPDIPPITEDSLYQPRRLPPLDWELHADGLKTLSVRGQLIASQRPIGKGSYRITRYGVQIAVCDEWCARLIMSAIAAELRPPSTITTNEQSQ